MNTPYYTNTPLTKYASRLANFGILVTWLVPLIHSLPLNSVTHITVVSHRRPWVHLQCSRHVTVAIVIWLEGKRERRENLGCGQYVMLHPPLVLFWSALWCWVYLWKPKWAWPMYSFAPAWAPSDSTMGQPECICFHQRFRLTSTCMEFFVTTVNPECERHEIGHHRVVSYCFNVQPKWIPKWTLDPHWAPMSHCCHPE